VKNPSLVISLSFLAVMAAGTVPLLLLRAVPEQKPRPTTVRIVGIYTNWGHCMQNSAITFRASDGRTGQASVPTVKLACRQGDIVPAEYVGVSVRLADRSCLTPGPRIGSLAC
jgi:hypothetical protein